MLNSIQHDAISSALHMVSIIMNSYTHLCRQFSCTPRRKNLQFRYEAHDQYENWVKLEKRSFAKIHASISQYQLEYQCFHPTSFLALPKSPPSSLIRRNLHLAIIKPPYHNSTRPRETGPSIRLEQARSGYRAVIIDMPSLQTAATPSPASFRTRVMCLALSEIRCRAQWSALIILWSAFGPGPRAGVLVVQTIGLGVYPVLVFYKG